MPAAIVPVPPAPLNCQTMTHPEGGRQIDAPAEGLTVTDLADRYGVNETTVRRWIKSGMPGAEKAGHPPRWIITDPQLAAAWIAANAPRTTAAPIAAAAIAGANGTGQDLAGEPPLDPADATVDGHIHRLNHILLGLTELTFKLDHYDPRLTSGIKHVSAELRQLQEHRRAMLEADERTMDREHHERILAAFAGLVVEELQAFARQFPDVIVDALVDARVKVEAKRVTRLLHTVADQELDQLRNRLADAVGQAEAIE